MYHGQQSHFKIINHQSRFSSKIFKMWSRAVWREETIREEEAAIPTIWLQNGAVRWPTGLNVLRAFERQQAPTQKWDTFPLIKVKCTSG
jgi:hypothetical protein